MSISAVCKYGNLREPTMMNACRSFRIGRALTVGLVLIGVDMGAALGAGQTPHDAEECRSIRDDADRLACYDRANSATPAAAAMPDAAPVQAPTAAVPAANLPHAGGPGRHDRNAMRLQDSGSVSCVVATIRWNDLSAQERAALPHH